MIIDMRLPVTSRRRCVQITALGASEVPDVKISAQMLSTSGSRPGSSAVTGERVGQRRTERGRGVVGIGEPRRHVGSGQSVGDRREQCLVTRLGDQEPAVGVLHVAQQLLVAPRVVHAHDRGAEQRGTAERKEVVGRVVEQDGHVTRAGGRENLVEQRREPARLREVLACVHARSPNFSASRSPCCSALRRSSAAAFGATSGACPGAGTARARSDEPDIGVRYYAGALACCR